MSYELIAQCIRSGQLTDAQIQEHLKDEVFAAWYRARYLLPTGKQPAPPRLWHHYCEAEHGWLSVGDGQPCNLCGQKPPQDDGSTISPLAEPASSEQGTPMHQPREQGLPWR